MRVRKAAIKVIVTPEHASFEEPGPKILRDASKLGQILIFIWWGEEHAGSEGIETRETHPWPRVGRLRSSATGRYLSSGEELFHCAFRTLKLIRCRNVEELHRDMKP